MANHQESIEMSDNHVAPPRVQYQNILSQHGVDSPETRSFKQQHEKVPGFSATASIVEQLAQNRRMIQETHARNKTITSLIQQGTPPA